MNKVPKEDYEELLDEGCTVEEVIDELFSGETILIGYKTVELELDYKDFIKALENKGIKGEELLERLHEITEGDTNIFYETQSYKPYGEYITIEFPDGLVIYFE